MSRECHIRRLQAALRVSRGWIITCSESAQARRDLKTVDAALAMTSVDADEIARLRKIVRDTLWMACRYAHGRQSYSVAMYNEAARDALALGVLDDRTARNEPVFAIDGSVSREMSGLTEAEFNEAWVGWYKGDAIPNHCRKDW